MTEFTFWRSPHTGTQQTKFSQTSLSVDAVTLPRKTVLSPGSGPPGRNGAVSLSFPSCLPSTLGFPIPLDLSLHRAPERSQCHPGPWLPFSWCLFSNSILIRESVCVISSVSTFQKVLLKEGATSPGPQAMEIITKGTWCIPGPPLLCFQDPLVNDTETNLTGEARVWHELWFCPFWRKHWRGRNHIIKETHLIYPWKMLALVTPQYLTFKLDLFGRSHNWERILHLPRPLPALLALQKQHHPLVCRRGLQLRQSLEA